MTLPDEQTDISISNLAAMVKRGFDGVKNNFDEVFNRLAQHRLRRGLAVLESGSRVVTDRLHAHILCVLLNTPHRLLDDSDGKNRAFVDAWTAEYDGLDYADARMALKLAR